METEWHLLSQEQIFKKLNTSLHGLSFNEVQNRIKQYGLNTLPEKKKISLFQIFLGQFNSPLIFVLLGASIITYLIGETTDACIIFAVLVFNAIVGTIQEGKAQNTLNALKKFVETKATVLRNGTESIISDREVVPGDIINLEEGEKIPADARVILSQNLKADEASLTGESEPVYKTAEALKQEVSTADQKNMLFKGTHIVSGNGRAVVVGTGSFTAIGKIAKEISSIDTEIPLKANIRYLTRAIIIAVGIICTVLFGIGIATGESIRTMFTIVVSLSVSIIPEGLPIVMTLVLATGVWRMSKRNALVKKLQAVEALGQARVIAVDKTGTITKNELVVRQVWVADKLFDVGGVGYEPTGNITFGNNVIDAVNHPELLMIAKATALCANARLIISSDNEKKWNIAGDPTEAAMIVFARKIGFNKEDLLTESPLLQEMPFDYKLKYHAVINSIENKNLLTVIGAPENIIKLSKNIISAEGTRLILEEDRKKLEEILIKMSLLGQRVVAVGTDENTKDLSNPQSISNLTFIGFLAMKDVLRLEVKEAMDRAQEAGIKVIMITGDHKITAMAIAREADIYHNGDEILTGSEIDAMNDYELSDKLSQTTVFARVTPEHKLKIINAFKKRGEIIAMTGDGVNDAPSLVAADLGVAMGNIGTEVAKEAADIVLLDDNFGSIVSAVEEGRSIYKTIKKVILYLFSTSIGEVFTIIGALLFGMPLPILAAQIIWLNLVTDGFLDVSLAMEPKEDRLLSGKFERPKKYLIDKLMLQRMILMAIPMMIGTLFLFQKYIDIDTEKAWTISLTTLAVFQWFNAWNCRSDSKSIFQSNPFSNKFLLGATFIVIVLQLLAVYTPVLQKILHTVSLGRFDWLIIISIALSIIFVEEIRKFFARRIQRIFK